MTNSNRFRSILFCALAVLAAAVVFWPALRNGLTNFDDPQYITFNPRIRDLSFAGLKSIIALGADSIYIPLTFLGYAIQYHFFQANPLVYHVTSWILHLGSVALVFALAKKLTSQDKTALLAALFFGIHPLRVEPVAWAASQKDVLSTFFFFASLLSYRQFVESRKGWTYGASLAAFTAALLSKPVTIMLPFVLFLVDRVRPQAVKKASLAEKIPFFAVAAALIGITLRQRQLAIQVFEPNRHLTLGDRIAGTGNALIFYLTKALAPLNLSCAYPVRKLINMSQSEVLWGVIACFAAAGVLFALIKKRTSESFGVTFFIVTLIPMLPFMPLGAPYTADRYSYVPAFGLALSAAVLLGRVMDSEGAKKIAAQICAAAIVLFFGVLAWQRCSVWSDGLTLWENTLKQYPTMLIALKGKAEAHYVRGMSDNAAEDLKQVLFYHPQEAVRVHSMLGDVYLQKQDYASARESFDKALQMNPADAHSRAGRDAADNRIKEAAPRS